MACCFMTVSLLYGVYLYHVFRGPIEFFYVSATESIVEISDNNVNNVGKC